MFIILVLLTTIQTKNIVVEWWGGQEWPDRTGANPDAERGRRIKILTQVGVKPRHFSFVQKPTVLPLNHSGESFPSIIYTLSK